MVFSRLFIFAAQTIASNPKVRKQALDYAKNSWVKAEPKIRETSKKINDVAKEVSLETPPDKDFFGFL